MKTTALLPSTLNAGTLVKHRLVTQATRELLHWSCLLRSCTYQFSIAKLHTLLIYKIEEVALFLSSRNCLEEEVDKIRFMLCTEMDEAMIEYLDKRDLGRYRSLTEHYYKEHLGGEHFFDIIHTTGKFLHTELGVLSLAHMILCIGFRGQYALKENGLSKLVEIKDTLFFKIKTILPDPKFVAAAELEAQKKWELIAFHVKTKILPLTLVCLMLTYGFLYSNLLKSIQQLHITIYNVLSL